MTASPCAFSSAARAVMAIVADGATASSRCDTPLVIGFLHRLRER